MKKKGFVANLLAQNSAADNSVLTYDERIIDTSRIHWWIFVIPAFILIVGIYLWLKAVTKGSFNLMSLLHFPPTNPKFIPAALYEYILVGMSYINSHMPEPIYNFLSNTYLHPRKWLSQIVLLYGLYKLIRAAFTFISTEVTLTNNRIIIKTGVIKPQYIDLPRNHINVFHYKRGILGRFFNVGTLVIQTTGGFLSSIPAMQAGMNIRREMLDSETKA